MHKPSRISERNVTAFPNTYVALNRAHNARIEGKKWHFRHVAVQAGENKTAQSNTDVPDKDRSNSRATGWFAGFNKVGSTFKRILGQQPEVAEGEKRSGIWGTFEGLLNSTKDGAVEAIASFVAQTFDTRFKRPSKADKYIFDRENLDWGPFELPGAADNTDREYDDAHLTKQWFKEEFGIELPFLSGKDKSVFSSLTLALAVRNKKFAYVGLGRITLNEYTAYALIQEAIKLKVLKAEVLTAVRPRKDAPIKGSKKGKSSSKASQSAKKRQAPKGFGSTVVSNEPVAVEKKAWDIDMRTFTARLLASYPAAGEEVAISSFANQERKLAMAAVLDRCIELGSLRHGWMQTRFSRSYAIGRLLSVLTGQNQAPEGAWQPERAALGQIPHYNDVMRALERRESTHCLQLVADAGLISEVDTLRHVNLEELDTVKGDQMFAYVIRTILSPSKVMQGKGPEVQSDNLAESQAKGSAPAQTVSGAADCSDSMEDEMAESVALGNRSIEQEVLGRESASEQSVHKEEQKVDAALKELDHVREEVDSLLQQESEGKAASTKTHASSEEPSTSTGSRDSIPSASPDETLVTNAAGAQTEQPSGRSQEGEEQTSVPVAHQEPQESEEAQGNTSEEAKETAGAVSEEKLEPTVSLVVTEEDVSPLPRHSLGGMDGEAIEPAPAVDEVMELQGRSGETVNGEASTSGRAELWLPSSDTPGVWSVDDVTREDTVPHLWMPYNGREDYERKPQGYIESALRLSHRYSWKSAGVIPYTFRKYDNELMVLVGYSWTRSTSRSMREGYTILGGKRSLSDASAEATAIRELTEETGGLLSGYEMTLDRMRNVLWYPLGGYAAFLCKVDSDFLVIPEEYEKQMRDFGPRSSKTEPLKLRWLSIESLEYIRGQNPRDDRRLFLQRLLQDTGLVDWLKRQQWESDRMNAQTAAIRKVRLQSKHRKERQEKRRQQRPSAGGSLAEAAASINVALRKPARPSMTSTVGMLDGLDSLLKRDKEYQRAWRKADLNDGLGVSLERIMGQPNGQLNEEWNNGVVWSPANPLAAVTAREQRPDTSFKYQIEPYPETSKGSLRVFHFRAGEQMVETNEDLTPQPKDIDSLQVQTSSSLLANALFSASSSFLPAAPSPQTTFSAKDNSRFTATLFPAVVLLYLPEVSAKPQPLKKQTKDTERIWNLKDEMKQLKDRRSPRWPAYRRRKGRAPP